MARPIQIFTAFARDGRLVLDADPASIGLTEGESIDLVDICELSLRGGCLSDEEEQLARDRELDRSINEAESGLTIEFDLVLAGLRERLKRLSSMAAGRSHSLSRLATRCLPKPFKRWLASLASKNPQAKE